MDDYDEAGYAIVAREMVQNNRYLTQTYLNKPWFEKPPLYMWLMAGAIKVFGLNEFAMRLPSALFGILGVIFTFLIMLELTRDREIAFFSGLILITMPFFLAAARHSRIDVPVTMAALAAVYFYLKGQKYPLFLSGIGISLGIGIMLKSVIGLLGVPIILIWSFIFKQWGWLKNKYFWLGILLMVVIVAPWHIYQIIKFGSVFLNDYFGYHLIQRATQNILSNSVSLNYYLWVLWKYSQPWTAVFINSLIGVGFLLLYPLARKKIKSYLPAVFAVFGAAFFVFGFFAIVKTRLLPYFTTMYPFAAGAIAATYLLIRGFFPEKRGWIPRFIFILLMIPAVLTTFREAFVRPKIYALDISIDEKAIGLYLANQHNDEDIRVFNWRHLQTLRYYSQKELDVIQFGEDTVAVNPPFWLILPTPILDTNPNLRNMPAPYSGRFLTLVHFVVR